jgi:hypothetical protein
VGRATAALQRLGLLRWDLRLVRDGWRVEQTSNAYELVPTLAATGAGRPANVPAFGGPRTGGQTDRATRRIDISYCPPSAEEVVAAQTALAAVRAESERRLLLKWHRALPAAN